ncbi:MAG: hypothetical protein LBN29_04120 [Mediterranea sp.]|jgi:hypothetical protein|nr:hypothetical protein [Mediterranea sp.]
MAQAVAGSITGNANSGGYGTSQDLTGTPAGSDTTGGPENTGGDGSGFWGW